MSKNTTLTDAELDYCNAEGIAPVDFAKAKAARSTLPQKTTATRSRKITITGSKETSKKVKNMIKQCPEHIALMMKEIRCEMKKTNRIGFLCCHLALQYMADESREIYEELEKSKKP